MTKKANPTRPAHKKESWLEKNEGLLGFFILIAAIIILLLYAVSFNLDLQECQKGLNLCSEVLDRERINCEHYFIRNFECAKWQHNLKCWDDECIDACAWWEDKRQQPSSQQVIYIYPLSQQEEDWDCSYRSGGYTCHNIFDKIEQRQCVEWAKCPKDWYQIALYKDHLECRIDWAVREKEGMLSTPSIPLENEETTLFCEMDKEWIRCTMNIPTKQGCFCWSDEECAEVN